MVGLSSSFWQETQDIRINKKIVKDNAKFKTFSPVKLFLIISLLGANVWVNPIGFISIIHLPIIKRLQTGIINLYFVSPMKILKPINYR